MQGIKNYIFDLDATLYQDSGEVEVDYERRIIEFFQIRLNLSKEEAKGVGEEILRKFRWEAQGVEPMYGISQKEFMDYIGDVSVSHLPACPELAEQLKKLNGRLFVFTDSTINHVRDSLKQLCVDENLFSGIFDAEMGNFAFKFNNESFERLFEYYNINPQESVLFEDKLLNLKFAKSFGMKTILISDKPQNETYIDFQFPNINKALEKIAQK